MINVRRSWGLGRGGRRAGSVVALLVVAAVRPHALRPPSPAPSGVLQEPKLDLLITGGSVYDGSGAPPSRSIIGIRGDRIVLVRPAGGALPAAARVIDAAGLVVAPGFIDPHSHTFEDLSSPAGRAQADYLFQGVTTVVTGNDGGGPIAVGRSFKQWTETGIGTNAALYVGHGTVRGAVLGMSDRAPTAAELGRMRELVRQAMAEGALGLSTGLYYAPGSYGTTEEVIELAKVAGAAGGIYDSHLRDESSYTVGLLAAVDEALRIGREAHLPVHIAHVKALGRDVWGYADSIIAHVARARASGQVVTADQYPYNASGTSVGASLLPRWAEAGGRDSLRKRFGDSATRENIVAAMLQNLRRRGGAAAMLITSAKDRSVVGKTLDVVGRERGRDSIAVAIELIEAGDASVASFNMLEADIERLMAQDFVVTGSDGSSGHPRKFGTFPRKFSEYVLKRGVISFARAVQASSSQTAELLGLDHRGFLKAGFYADVIGFDSTTFRDRATYEAPTQLATGVQFVIVNGRLAIDGAKPTQALAGRPLPRRTLSQ
ncbi:MAG: amidohydrolase family protein [Gemmatimonadota bacterium]